MKNYFVKVLLLSLLCVMTSAEITNWITPAGGDWFNASNWDNGIPGSNSTAVINSVGMVWMSESTHISVTSVIVTNTMLNVSNVFASQAFTAQSTSTVWFYQPTLIFTSLQVSNLTSLTFYNTISASNVTVEASQVDFGQENITINALTCGAASTSAASASSSVQTESTVSIALKLNLGNCNMQGNFVLMDGSVSDLSDAKSLMGLYTLHNRGTVSFQPTAETQFLINQQNSTFLNSGVFIYSPAVATASIVLNGSQFVNAEGALFKVSGGGAFSASEGVYGSLFVNLGKVEVLNTGKFTFYTPLNNDGDIDIQGTQLSFISANQAVSFHSGSFYASENSSLSFTGMHYLQNTSMIQSKSELKFNGIMMIYTGEIMTPYLYLGKEAEAWFFHSWTGSNLVVDYGKLRILSNTQISQLVITGLGGVTLAANVYEGTSTALTITEIFNWSSGSIFGLTANTQLILSSTCRSVIDNSHAHLLYETAILNKGDMNFTSGLAFSMYGYSSIQNTGNFSVVGNGTNAEIEGHHIPSKATGFSSTGNLFVQEGIIFHVCVASNVAGEQSIAGCLDTTCNGNQCSTPSATTGDHTSSEPITHRLTAVLLFLGGIIIVSILVAAVVLFFVRRKKKRALLYSKLNEEHQHLLHDDM